MNAIPSASANRAAQMVHRVGLPFKGRRARWRRQAAKVRKQIVMSPVKEGKGKGRRVEGQTGERSREAFLTLSLSLSL